MKKLLLLVLMCGFIAGAAIGQDQKDMKDRQEWDQKVKTELKLTDDQTAKYDAVSKEYGDKIDALKKDASMTKDAMKAKKMELKKEKQAKLFEFLTPEQQTRYSQLIEEKMKDKPTGK